MACITSFVERGERPLTVPRDKIDESRSLVKSSAESHTDVEDDSGPETISLGKRLRSPQTIISFLIAFAIIGFVFRNLDLNFGLIWANIRTANPTYLALGFAVYYGSFPLRAMRWRRLLNNAGITREDGFAVPGLLGLSEMYVLSWFANCLVPAKLGDAYRGYLMKKHAGPSFGRTMGTIFAERVMDVFALVGLLLLASLVVFRGTMPESLRVPILAGVALVILGIGGLLSLFFFGARLGQLIPRRLRPVYERTSHGLTTSFSRKGLTGAIVLTSVVWIMEGLRLFLVAAAFGVDLNPASSLLVALLASLLTIMPLTPAGLGVVEGGTILALKLLTIGATDAGSIAIVDRIIAYWSVILVGGVLYLVTKRK
jgi:glycosyltransferase 2 family protein